MPFASHCPRKQLRGEGFFCGIRSMQLSMTRDNVIEPETRNQWQVDDLLKRSLLTLDGFYGSTQGVLDVIA